MTFKGVSSSATTTTTTTLRLHYTNADSTQRYADNPSLDPSTKKIRYKYLTQETSYATVIVNGVSHIVAFVPTGSDNIVGSSTLTVPLKSGTTNVIEFESYEGGWGKLQPTASSPSSCDRKCMLTVDEAANIDRIMVPIS